MSHAALVRIREAARKFIEMGQRIQDGQAKPEELQSYYNEMLEAVENKTGECDCACNSHDLLIQIAKTYVTQGKIFGFDTDAVEKVIDACGRP